MIKDNQTRLNRLHVLLDALVIAAAYVFSWFITLKSGLFGADPEAGILPTWFYMRVLVVIIPVYLLSIPSFICLRQSGCRADDRNLPTSARPISSDCSSLEQSSI